MIESTKRNIIILWAFLHIGLLAILLNQGDVMPWLLALIGVVGVVGAILLWRVADVPRWLQSVRLNPLFMALVLIAGTILLLITWIVPVEVALSALDKELLRAYVTLLILAITHSLLFWRQERELCLPFWIWLAVGAVVASVGVIITVHYVDRFPQLNTIDELHNWVVQWTFANTGLLGDTLYKQMIPIPQPIYDSPHYILGLLLRYIGDGFWQARMARLLLSCLALPFIYLSGKRMYGPRTGLFAVVFAIFLLAPTAYVRPDVFVGVMLSVAIYVYLRAQTTRRPWMHYLTGLCVALGIEGHPLAYRFGLAFTLIYMARWLYGMIQARRVFIDGRVFALALGGFTAILIYLAIHILPNVEQGLHFAHNNGLGAQTDQGQAALFSIQRQFYVWVTTSPVELVFVVAGVALAAYQFEHGDRLLLALLVVNELVLLGTYGYYREFYQVHLLPVFALLAGRALANLTEVRQSRIPAGRLAGLALAGMVFIALIGNLTGEANAAVSDPYRDEFTAIARRLKADLPANAIVVGNENYFIEMRSLNYYGIQTVTTNKWFLVNYQGYDLWNVTKPDIFILSGDMDTPRYMDMGSITRYMDDHGFVLARCYTETGLINAQVYVQKLPPGWTIDPECHMASGAGQWRE